MSLLTELWPRRVEKRLQPLRDKALAHAPDAPKPAEERRWRLWQVESAVACNLRCVMCPWQDERERAGEAGVMSEDVWAAVRPHLSEIATVDFTGGGEPLLNPALASRVAEAKSFGCRAGFLTNATELSHDVAEELLAAGVDWITISIDGPTKESYEQVRLGARFEEVIDNVRGLSALRGAAKRPALGVNFVMMPNNVHLLEPMVRLVADLGVDKLVFKQADVVRGEHGEGYGLYTQGKRERRAHKKALARATRLARRLGLETTSFAFEPEEQPVCEQDPRTSIFVRYDGRIAPCINLAYGGETTFLGRPALLPTVHYGQLPEDDPLEIWNSNATCRAYRETFGERVRIFDDTMLEGALGEGISRLERAEKRAFERMPPAPESCRQCHYLYDV
jgi:MoaA/NifB/PqqE/SkfB family radical SAM enzyme